MAYLEAGASLAEVVAQWEATARYDLVADTTLCKEHIEACRILIGRTLDEVRQGGASTRDNSAKYQRALEKAEGWLAAQGAATGVGAGDGHVRYVDVSRMRG